MSQAGNAACLLVVLGSEAVQHGGRATAGGRVLWWVWVLVAWSLLAVLLGVVLGRVLRAAERRERGHDREARGQEPGEPEAEERPCAS